MPTFVECLVNVAHAAGVDELDDSETVLKKEARCQDVIVCQFERRRAFRALATIVKEFPFLTVIIGSVRLFF